MRIKYRKARYKDGDHLIQSDLTGRIMYASESRKLWNGQICHKDEWEMRNPQDFVRAREEREPKKDVRPRTQDFLTSPVTGDDL